MCVYSCRRTDIIYFQTEVSNLNRLRRNQSNESIAAAFIKATRRQEHQSSNPKSLDPERYAEQPKHWLLYYTRAFVRHCPKPASDSKREPYLLFSVPFDSRCFKSSELYAMVIPRDVGLVALPICSHPTLLPRSEEKPCSWSQYSNFKLFYGCSTILPTASLPTNNSQ